MASEKIDWGALFKKYQTSYVPRGITAKDFFNEFNVNANTGRKQFAKLSKLSVSEDKKTTIKKGSLVKGSLPKGSLNKGSLERGSLAKAKRDHEKVKAHAWLEVGQVTGHTKKKIKTTEKGKRLTTLQPERYRDASSDAQILNSGRFSKGNGAAIRHGGYMDVMKIDDDIKELMLSVPTDDLHSLNAVFESRFLMMNRLLDERIETLIELDSKGHKFVNDNNEQMSLRDMIRQAYWGSMPALTNVFSVASLSKTNALKADIDIEIKRYKLRKEVEQKNTTMKLMSEWSESEDITALSTVNKMEELGIKAPNIMTAMAIKELEQTKPVITDEGLSDEELDLLASKHLSVIERQVNDLSDRHKRLNELMAKSRMEFDKGDMTEEEFSNNTFTGLEDLEEMANEMMEQDTVLADDQEWD